MVKRYRHDDEDTIEPAIPSLPDSTLLEDVWHAGLITTVGGAMFVIGCGLVLMAWQWFGALTPADRTTLTWLGVVWVVVFVVLFGVLRFSRWISNR